MLNSYCEDLVSALCQAASASIPKKVNRRIWISGWNENTERKQREANDAYRLWKGEDKPRQGRSFELMKLTRKNFRNALKSIRQENRERQGQILLEKLKSNNQSDF